MLAASTTGRPCGAPLSTAMAVSARSPPRPTTRPRRGRGAAQSPSASVHIERLQLGRRSHVYGAALHDESARPLALGCRQWDPLNPLWLGAADDDTTGIGQVCGGTIVFGSGVALFKGQTRVGGLGVSGDTACADHEIAKRVGGGRPRA